MTGAQLLSIGWAGPADVLGGLGRALGRNWFSAPPEPSGRVEAHHSYAVYSGALSPSKHKSPGRPT